MALKTNSKQARTNLDRYILDWMADEIEEANEWNERTGDPKRYDPESITSVCGYILEYFRNTAKPEILRYGERIAFEDWAQGLPLGGLFCYYYNREAVDDLGDILEQSETERNKFTEREAEKCLTSLIFNECKKRTA